MASSSYKAFGNTSYNADYGTLGAQYQALKLERIKKKTPSYVLDNGLKREGWVYFEDRASDVEKEADSTGRLVVVNLFTPRLLLIDAPGLTTNASPPPDRRPPTARRRSPAAFMGSGGAMTR